MKNVEKWRMEFNLKIQTTLLYCYKVGLLLLVSNYIRGFQIDDFVFRILWIPKRNMESISFRKSVQELNLQNCFWGQFGKCWCPVSSIWNPLNYILDRCVLNNTLRCKNMAGFVQASPTNLVSMKKKHEKNTREIRLDFWSS